MTACALCFHGSMALRYSSLVGPRRASRCCYATPAFRVGGARLQGLYEYFPASWWRVLLGTLDRNCKQKNGLNRHAPSFSRHPLVIEPVFKGLGRDVLMQTMMYQKQTRGGKNNTCFAIPLYLLYTFTLCIHLVNTSITHDNNTRMAHDKI